ncbi:MAG TPA: ribonuclease E/G [Stellaceae bacterium]|nr:ribonuclease E/G [Stellaceae bacterium]
MNALPELLISWAPGEARGLLRLDGRPVELLVERERAAGLLDAVFLGRLVRIVPSLPGAFFDIGEGSQVFAPGEDWPPEGTMLPMQIVKEARADKPPEATRSLSLHGLLGVWTPARPGLAVSRQLAPPERARLSAAAAPLLAEGEGLVLRSHAEGASAEEIAQDVARLRERHARLMCAVAAAKGAGRLEAAPDAVVRLIQRASAGNRLGRVLIDDAEAWRLARVAIGEKFEAPILHDPALDDSDVDAVFEAALAPVVALAGGGDLVLEPTTAGIMIDVNLGRAAEGKRQAVEAILALNLTAAEAVARELRLRNLAGAIIVDFISMRRRGDRDRVLATLTRAVADDPATVEVHGWTRLGHVELTRRRRAPSLAEIMSAPVETRPLTAESVACNILRRLVRAGVRPGGITIRAATPVLTLLQGAMAGSFAMARTRTGRQVMLEPLPGQDIEKYDIVGI